MRTKRAITNIVFSILIEILLIVMGFVAPKIVIKVYGSDVNGLTSTINHVISLLNLLQAGAVGASIFQMLKPVAHKDFGLLGLGGRSDLRRGVAADARRIRNRVHEAALRPLRLGQLRVLRAARQKDRYHSQDEDGAFHLRKPLDGSRNAGRSDGRRFRYAAQTKSGLRPLRPP